MQRQAATTLDLLTLFKNKPVADVIAHHLIPEDIASLQKTNRELRDNAVLNAENLWQEKLELHFSKFRRDRVDKEFNARHQFIEAYRKDYEHITPRQRKIFSLLNEGKCRAVIELLGFEDLGIYGDKMLACQMNRLGSRELLDYAFALAVETMLLQPPKVADNPHYFNHRTQPWRYSFLHWAVIFKQPLTVFKRWLDNGSDIEARDQWDQTPLLCAVSYDREDVIDYLLQRGANKYARDRDGDDLMLKAVCANHPHLVAKFLADDPDLERRNNEGKTAVILAAERGLIEMLDDLLKRGADLNARAYNGQNALMLAIRNWQTDMAKHLIEKNIDINAVSHVEGLSGNTALMFAITSGLDEIADILLAREVDIHYVNHWGSNALLLAAQQNKIDLVKRLIALGADPHHKDDSQSGLLHSFAMNGHIDLVREQLARGEDAFTCSKAFYSAVAFNKLEIAKLLLDNGANIDIQDTSRETAVFHALRYGMRKDNHAMLDMLISRGANVNIMNLFYETPLMIAILHNDLVSIQTLLNAGADITAKDDKGKTALMRAIEHNQPKAANLIRRQMIREYVAKKSAADAPEYKREYSLFGHRFSFGYSKHVKINAANAMLQMLEGGSQHIPAELTGALRQGELGEICKGLSFSCSSLRARA